MFMSERTNEAAPQRAISEDLAQLIEAYNAGLLDPAQESKLRDELVDVVSAEIDSIDHDSDLQVCCEIVEDFDKKHGWEVS